MMNDTAHLDLPAYVTTLLARGEKSLRDPDFRRLAHAVDQRLRGNLTPVNFFSAYLDTLTLNNFDALTRQVLTLSNAAATTLPATTTATDPDQTSPHHLAQAGCRPLEKNDAPPPPPAKRSSVVKLAPAEKGAVAFSTRQGDVFETEEDFRKPRKPARASLVTRWTLTRRGSSTP